MMGTVANARSSSASGGKNILLLLPAATCCYLLHRPCVCVHDGRVCVLAGPLDQTVCCTPSLAALAALAAG